MVRAERDLIEPEEFARLEKSPKREILARLAQFVRKKVGRPRIGIEPLTGAERMRRLRKREDQAKREKPKRKAKR
jgi:hypothetical protein